jgi:hypothetical protein
MTTRAVILIPAEGGHARQLYWSARALDDKVYRKRAEIVKAVVTPLKAFDAPHQSRQVLTTASLERDRLQTVQRGAHHISLSQHGVSGWLPLP